MISDDFERERASKYHLIRRRRAGKPDCDGKDPCPATGKQQPEDDDVILCTSWLDFQQNKKCVEKGDQEIQLDVLHTSDWNQVLSWFRVASSNAQQIHQVAKAAAAATLSLINQKQEKEQQKTQPIAQPSRTPKDKCPAALYVWPPLPLDQETLSVSSRATKRRRLSTKDKNISSLYLDSRFVPDEHPQSPLWVVTNTRDVPSPSWNMEWRMKRKQERFDSFFQQALDVWITKTKVDESGASTTLSTFWKRVVVEVRWYLILKDLPSSSSVEAHHWKQKQLSKLLLDIDKAIEKQCKGCLCIKNRHVLALREANFSPLAFVEEDAHLHARRRWQDGWDAMINRWSDLLLTHPEAAKDEIDAQVPQEGPTLEVLNWKCRQMTLCQQYMQGKLRNTGSLDVTRALHLFPAVSDVTCFTVHHIARLIAAGMTISIVKGKTKNHRPGFEERLVEWILFRSKHHEDKLPTSLSRWVLSVQQQFQLFQQERQDKGKSPTHSDTSAEDEASHTSSVSSRKPRVWMTQYHVDQLRSVGVPMVGGGVAPNSKPRMTWEDRLAEYQEYCRIHHTHWCPKHGQGRLGLWCAVQRKLYRKQVATGKACPPLTDERIRLLNQAGFLWERPAVSTMHVPDDEDGEELKASVLHGLMTMVEEEEDARNGLAALSAAPCGLPAMLGV